MISGKEIADNIRAERNRAKITIEEVAKKLEITRQTYAEYEKNGEIIKASTLVKLSNIFKCNISDFFIQRWLTKC